MEFSMYIHCIIFIYLTMESLVLSRPSATNYYTSTTVNPHELSTTKMNVSRRRKVRLRSMKSKQYIQVFDKQVDAKGDETSIYANLSLESVGFSGKIRIRGIKANRYICFSRKHAKLITKRTGNSAHCVFTKHSDNRNEIVFQYTKKNNRHWYVAFKGSGKPRKGNQFSKHHHQADARGEIPRNATFRFKEIFWKNEE